MADIFRTEDVRKLLIGKRVVLLGSSNIRGTYKDLILLLSRNEISSTYRLKMRGEESYEGDKRIVFNGLMKGRQYEEGREFVKYDMHVEYHFISRCYTPNIVKFLRKIQNGEMKVPDVIIMNSCVWDISRWGPNGVDAYKQNMKKLMLLLKECLPEKTLFIWTTALPVSTEIKGGLLVKQLDFMQSLLRFEIMEANLFCRHLVVSHGYDVLDTHYHLRMQVHRRLQDGIHYGPLPVRFITNLILTHISLSWNVPLPGNDTGIALQRVIRENVLQTSKKEEVKLPIVPVSLCPKNKNSESPSPKKKTKYNRNINKGSSINKRRTPYVPTWPKEPQGWKNDEMWVRPVPSQGSRYRGIQMQSQPPNDYWSDSRFGQRQEEFARSKYANFDQAPPSGPIRRNTNYQRGRHQPY